MRFYRVGDEVVMDVAKENLDWGYRPIPNGTKVKIVEFGEIDYGRTRNFGNPPGIYENTCWAFVEVGGKRYKDIISTCFLKLPEAVLRSRQEKKEYSEDRKKLRDLPETKFWEEDKVRLTEYAAFKHRWGSEKMRIASVGYLRDWCDYDVALSEGGQVGLQEGDLELVERGNVWKYYHNEPMVFASLEEEAGLMLSMGFASEQKNPNTGFYGWSLEEVLASIAAGDVDGFTAGGGIGFSLRDENRAPSITAYKYNDRDLGKRVAQATLKGFGR